MFKKLLNVGKGHSSSERSQLQQQQQLQQKSLFQLNEIRSYGFTNICCLGYSSALSLLAVGSKTGLLRILGNPSVEFSYQLESGNAIRQIEFIHQPDQTATTTTTTTTSNNKKQQQQQQQQQDKSEHDPSKAKSAAAKLVVLTDNGQLHLFELTTVRPANFTDNTTQTEVALNNDCCQPTIEQRQSSQAVQDSSLQKTPAYTKLQYIGHLDYFIFKFEDEDRSRRVTTLEISSNGQIVYVGTEGGNLYRVPIEKFEPIDVEKVQNQQRVGSSLQRETGVRQILDDVKEGAPDEVKTSSAREKDVSGPDADDETTAMNLNDEPQIEQGDGANEELFETIMYEEDVATQLGDEIKPKKQGAIESIKKHPASNDKILVSFHRGLSILYDVKDKQVDKYFYHNQILESSCFAGSQNGDFFYTSHNDGSYIKWDTKKGTQSRADDDHIGQLYGPYPCKPTPKIQACTGLVNEQLEDLIVFSGGMPRATYDDKNPVTIVRSGQDGKDSIKVVLDFTSKVLDFVVITKPKGSLGIAGVKSSGGGGKKGKNKHQQQQKQQHNQQIAVALAILADEEFVVIDLLNSESYLEFPLPYLNCVQPSAITCNQHYSGVSDELYEQLLAYSRQHMKGKLSQNEWPIQGGKVINAPDVKSHDILLTGHEDGSVNMWDVSDFSMRHLLHVPTARFFSTEDDELVPINGLTEGADATAPNDSNGSANHQESAWPPLKRVGRFDPYSDDTRLAIRKISLCAQTGTLLVAGTGGQVILLELDSEPSELETLVASEVNIVADSRFVWKGREKLNAKPGLHKFEPGYKLVSCVQLNPPAAATSTDLRADWHLFAVGTSYGFILYDYANKQCVLNRCTLNVQDFAIVSGDLGAMSRKKSFRKSLRESFRRLRRGRSQRAQPTASSTGAAPGTTGSSTDGAGDAPTSGPRKAFGRTVAAGGRTFNAAHSNDTAQQAAAAHRNLLSGERQVEVKVELSSIVKCITLCEAVITSDLGLFKPSLWVGTNSGQVLVYAIDLASDQQQQQPRSSSEISNSDATTAGTTTESASQPKQLVARLTKEIQLKHKAPIVAIFTSPDAPAVSHQSLQQDAAAQVAAGAASESAKSSPEKSPGDLFERSPDQKSQTNESEANEVGAAAAGEQPARSQSPVAEKSPSKSIASKGDQASQQHQKQPRVLICSEEQFKVFNLPNLKPFCKFKLTAHEGLRAKKISITQFLRPTAAAASQNIGNNQQQQQQSALLSSASSNKLQSTTTLNSSKSLQSFATQTSPSASPIPPAAVVGSSAEGAEEQQQPQQANGSGNNNKSSLTTSAKQAESNNNSLLAPNNNTNGSQTTSKQQDKELLNAKFGAKANSSSSTAAAITSVALSDKQQQDSPATDEAIFEPYMVCMSNQGDCAIYSVPDLKRQAQIQVCKREDVNGITSAMLTNYGEGYYLRSSSNFLRFSISSQRVLRVLSVV